jgi:alpha-mannosidase
MKLLLMLIAVACIPVAATPQTTVDRVVSDLEFLSQGTLDHWKYSVDFSGDPTSTSFDDRSWTTLTLNQSLALDSCWIRKEIVLPDRMLGQTTAGVVRLMVTVDDYGYLWVNGESKGYFPWDGDFELTKDAHPGQKFVLAIKAFNTGGPLRLIHAHLATAKGNPLAALVDDLTLSLRVGQKLLSFDTYQTNARKREDPGIDKSRMDRDEKKKLNVLLQSAAGEIDVAALRDGNAERFRSSIDAVRKKLKPVADFAHRFTIFFDANAHIDAAWLWRSKETIQVCRNTFASVIHMMTARPDFTYTQSAAAYYDWMERLYPDIFRQIQARVKDGRWEVVGGMWVEPDCNLPSGESWSRQLLYAKSYFKDKLGVNVTIGWNPDSFGYNWMIPAFYTRAGIDAFITQKIGWNDTDVFPYRVFWWESPDGSRILSYFPFDYVNTVSNPMQLVDWLRQFEANTGFTKMLILFGVGDHGGGPSLEMLDRIDHLKSIEIYPTIEYGTTGSYLSWLRSNDLTELPVWDRELYLEYHRGTFTTQSAMKAYNRSNEVLLTNAEKMRSFDAWSGGKPLPHALDDAWKKVLFNQFHDILPGSGIREIYIDAAEEDRQAQEIGNHELTGAFRELANRINTRSTVSGTPLIVFNTLAWERTDLAAFSLPEGDADAWSVFDDHGKEIPSQIEQESRYHRKLIFIARDIPPFGYTTYYLRKARSSTHFQNLSASRTTMENSLFHLTMDSTTGWIASITDKQLGRELLAGEGNRLQLLEDKPSAWDAWNIGLTGTEYPSTFRGMEIAEVGPVRSILRCTRDYLKPGTKKDFPTGDFPSSFFTQDIILYNGLDRIDFVTRVDWWEDKTMLKVAFPLAVQDTIATYEIPYGTIARSTQTRTSYEKAQFEVPAERWADVSSDAFGISLLNVAKYGYDIKGNMMRLSLLRSPKWPDPTADRGKHTIHYSLFPHAGRWETSRVLQRGYEVNAPLLTFGVESHTGTLPARHSFLSVSPPTIVLTTVKEAMNEKGWILQWYEGIGRSTDAVVHFAAKPKRVIRSNIMEEDGAEIPLSGKDVTVPTGAHGIVTIKVLW